MKRVLKRVYDYRDLRARRDLLRMPLDPQEEQRLRALEGDLLSQKSRPSLFAEGDRRRFLRMNLNAAASVEVGMDTAQEVRVLNVSGGGLVIRPPTPLGRGDLTIVTIREDNAVYHLPSQVMWTSEDAQGLCFIGVPGIPPVRS